MIHRKNKSALKQDKQVQKNLAISLITHKYLQTTLSKAKSLRRFVEPLISKSQKAKNAQNKAQTTHYTRQIFAKLQSKQAVKTLINEVANKVGNRPGGYTAVMRRPRRKGDNAERAYIHIVDYRPNPQQNPTTTQ